MKLTTNTQGEGGCGGGSFKCGGICCSASSNGADDNTTSPVNGKSSRIAGTKIRATSAAVRCKHSQCPSGSNKRPSKFWSESLFSLCRCLTIRNQLLKGAVTRLRFRQAPPRFHARMATQSFVCLTEIPSKTGTGRMSGPQVRAPSH